MSFLLEHVKKDRVTLMSALEAMQQREQRLRSALAQIVTQMDQQSGAVQYADNLIARIEEEEAKVVQEPAPPAPVVVEEPVEEPVQEAE